MPFKHLLALAPIAVLGLAGCGGNDGPSKKDFIVKADQTCKELARERDRTPYFRALESRGTGAESFEPREGELNATGYPRRMAAFADTAAELANRRVQRFKALELPSDGKDRDGAQAYIDGLRPVTTQTERLKTVIAEQRRVIRPVAGRMQATAKELEKRDKAGPEVYPASEDSEAWEREFDRYRRDQDRTQAALNRITGQIDQLTEADKNSTQKANVYGMRVCGEASFFLSF